MRKHFLTVTTLAAILVSAPVVFAADTPSFNMEEIIIQADAYHAPVDSSTINVKVISPGKASTIPELLRFSAGIDIQQRTIAGDNQDGTVKLRGFDARRFTVMLNGRPINTAGVMGGQYIDWTTIPLNTVEKIQIVKGAKLASDGNTLGGTINIITKSKGADGGEINILGGSNGRYDYLFQYNGNADKLHYQITTNKTGADAYLRNNNYDADQYGLRLNYDITTKDNLELGVNHTKSKRGYIIGNTPGTANYDPSYPTSLGDELSPAPSNKEISLNPGSYWDKTNNYYDFTYRHQITDGQWALAYWKNDEKRHEAFYNKAGVLTLDRTIISDKSDSLKFSGNKTINGSKFAYGLDYKQLRYGYGWQDYPQPDPHNIYPSQKANLFGAYVDDTWQLDKRWNGYVGLRYDQFSGSKDDAIATEIKNANYNNLSPKLNFSFKNNVNTTSFFSINRLWRSPSMAEYYWWQENYTHPTLPWAPWAGPNPSFHQELKPESGYSYEIGSQHRFSDNYTSKLTFYYQTINDYISFAHNYPYYCYNIDQAKIWGAEWENDLKLDAHNSLMFNYTNEHATQGNADLDYRPHHKASLSYLYDAKPWQAQYSISFAGQQSDSTSGIARNLGGYTTHNFSLTHQLDEQRSVSLYVDNIFAKQYVEEIGFRCPVVLTSSALNKRFSG